MDLVRVLHFADLHLGVESGGRTNPSSGLNQRVQDVCDRLDEVCACVEDEDVDVVLFAGDAFKHQHPTPTLQSLFAERIRRLARAGARVFLLVGNHDLPKMAALRHPFTIYDALEVEGVVVGDRAEVYRLDLPSGGVLQVAALPHFSRHQVLASYDGDGDPDDVIEALLTARVRALGQATDPSLPSVFCGHCHVNQAKLGATQDFFGVNDVEVSLSTLTSGQPFPYYALGHVHQRQVLGAEPFVAYSGSLERVDFGEGERVVVHHDGTTDLKEAEGKGFYRFDLRQDGERWVLADEPEFHAVSARRFTTLRAPDVRHENPADDVRARIAAAKGAGVAFEDALVKVVAEVDEADRGRIVHGDVAEVLAEAYDVRLVCEVTADSHTVRDPRFARRMSEGEALSSFLETREDWEDDREELLRLGREIIEQVLG